MRTLEGTISDRMVRLGDALSQLANVLVFNGDPNYSVSGDSWRFKRHRMVRFIDWLFSPIEADHCRKAYENDVTKARRLLAEVEP